MLARLTFGCVLGVFCALPSHAEAPKPDREVILFIRHAEKSPNGFGQLSCRGLNRSLALAAVLAARYKHIDAVFAPDPSQQKPDGALSYDYVRPLATVEPTAIRFGLPVHAAIGYAETDKLLAALQVSEFSNAVVLVAWEHHQLNDMVPKLVGSLLGDTKAIPKWERSNFDSIWRVTIERDGSKATASFTEDHQDLNDQSDLCPNSAAPPLEQPSPYLPEHK